MPGTMYEGARNVVDECHDKAFIGFISKKESDAEAKSRLAEAAVTAGSDGQGTPPQDVGGMPRAGGAPTGQRPMGSVPRTRNESDEDPQKPSAAP